MAAVTHRAATPDTGATPNTSAAFTPATGDLVCVFAVTSGSSGTAGTMTASANGLTFTNSGTLSAFGGGAHTINLLVADQLVGASPVSMTVDWAPTDAGTGTVLFVFSVSGVTRTGLSAIRQAAKQDNQSTGTAAPAFGAACLTGNPTVGCVGIEGGGANCAVPPSGWTELGDASFTAPVLAGEYCARDSGFTGTTVTWTSHTTTIFGSFIAEFDSTVAAIEPAVVAATAAIATPARLITTTPAVVPAVAAIALPAIRITVVPAVVAAVTAIPTPAVQAGFTLTPTTVAATATIATPTVGAAATVTPGTVVATGAVGAPAVQAGAGRTPTVVAAVGAIPAPTVTGGTSATATPAAVAATATVGSPAITVSHVAALGRLGVAVPAYFNPTTQGSVWDALIADHRGVPFIVVSPASGPGGSVDPDYTTRINQARAAGIRVMGYVDTNYGAVAAATADGEIDTWRSFYGIDGIFFDRAPGDTATVAYMTARANKVRATGAASERTVVVNPGWFPADEDHIDLCDHAMVFENDYTVLVDTPEAWYPAYLTSGAHSPDKFWWAFYDATVTEMRDVLARARRWRVGLVYVTDDTISPLPYDSLPSYWSTLLDEAATRATVAALASIPAPVVTTGADTEAPTVPADLHTTAVGSVTADLAWTASTDNVGVTQYEIKVIGPRT